MTLTFKVSFNEIHVHRSKGSAKYVIIKFNLDLDPPVQTVPVSEVSPNDKIKNHIAPQVNVLQLAKNQ